MDINDYLELAELLKNKHVEVETNGNLIKGIWSSTQINDRTGALRMVIIIDNRPLLIPIYMIKTIKMINNYGE